MEGLTSGELVAVARARGHRVSSSQLERWRQYGLISAARRRGRGRGAGLTWLHPDAAKEQLLTLLEIRKPREPLAELSIRLWLRRFETPIPRLRESLRRVVVVFSRLRRDVSITGVVGSGEQFVESLRRKPAKRPAFGIAKLDKEGYDRAQLIGDAIAAQFAATSTLPTEEQAAVIQDAMNLQPSEQSVIAALGANLKDEIRQTLPALSRADSAVATADESDLLAARELWLRIHGLDMIATQLPKADPLRDILLRLTHGHDSGFGLVLLVIVVQMVRAAGLGNAVERFDAAFGLSTEQEYGSVMGRVP